MLGPRKRGGPELSVVMLLSFEGKKYNRQSLKTMFTYTHQFTKQQHPHTWLCYSPPEHELFCPASKLMTHVSVFGKQGHKDWKPASQTIPNHEKVQRGNGSATTTQ